MLEQKLQNWGLLAFSVSELAAFLGKSRGYARLVAHRLVRRGVLAGVGKGRYCIAGTSELVVASNVVFPSYVSFLSALRFNNATTQLPAVVTVACGKTRKPVRYDGFEIEFIKLSPKKMFGYRKHAVGRGLALVADLEKAIVDCTALPQKGSLSEAFAAISQANSDKLVEYAERMKSSVVLKRMGLMMEKSGLQAPGRWKKQISRKYELLDPSFPPRGSKNSEWKVIENRVLE